MTNPTAPKPLTANQARSLIMRHAHSLRPQHGTFGKRLKIAWDFYKSFRAVGVRSYVLSVEDNISRNKHAARQPRTQAQNLPQGYYRIVQSTEKAYRIQVGAGLYWMPKSALTVRDGMAKAYGSGRQMLARKVAEAHGCDANHTYILDLVA